MSDEIDGYATPSQEDLDAAGSTQHVQKVERDKKLSVSDRMNSKHETSSESAPTPHIEVPMPLARKNANDDFISSLPERAQNEVLRYAREFSIPPEDPLFFVIKAMLVSAEAADAVRILNQGISDMAQRLPSTIAQKNVDQLDKAVEEMTNNIKRLTTESAQGFSEEVKSGLNGYIETIQSLSASVKGTSDSLKSSVDGYVIKAVDSKVSAEIADLDAAVVKALRRHHVSKVNISFVGTALALITTFALGFFTFGYMHQNSYIPGAQVLNGQHSYTVSVPYSAYKGIAKCGSRVCMEVKKQGLVASINSDIQ